MLVSRISRNQIPRKVITYSFAKIEEQAGKKVSKLLAHYKVKFKRNTPARLIYIFMRISGQLIACSPSS